MTARAPTPLPVPEGADRVVLFGGTFDPVHLGHVTLAGAARDAVAGGGRAFLVFVPAGRSPHKDEGPGAPPADRVRMLELAIGDLADAAVWTEELDRAGAGDEPSYWIDTLAAARARLGAPADLRFIIGTDQVLALPRWHRWEEVLELAEPVVLAREPHARVPDLIEAMRADPAWDGHDLDAWRRRVVRVPVLPWSATEIRRALARGDGRVPGLDPRVLAHIRERGLYRAA